MNSKFCGKCRSTNAEQTKFCMQCGENLEITASPASNYAQQSAASPNQFQPSSFVPPANNFSAAQSDFSPSPPFVAPNNFASPNAGFQSSHYQQTTSATTAASQKTGIGSKIASVLGVIVVGFILFLKFGFILLRASRLGGIWLIGIVLMILVVVGFFKLIRRGRK